jgi:hypothetical protein
MWSVDDAQIAARLDDDPSPWDQLTSSLVEPDLTVLGPTQETVDPAQLYAAFWGETLPQRPATERRGRWIRRRAQVT